MSKAECSPQFTTTTVVMFKSSEGPKHEAPSGAELAEKYSGWSNRRDNPDFCFVLARSDLRFRPIHFLYMTMVV